MIKQISIFFFHSSYGVVDEDNLFESLDSAAKEDGILPDSQHIKEMFGSWSNQRGFPLLEITRNYCSGSVVIHQKTYDTSYKPTNIERNIASTWWIPYNFASANDPEFNVTTPHGWLSPFEWVILNGTWSNDIWLIFNRQQTGFYRVLYDDRNYHLLNVELNYGNLNAIHPINRAQILDDLQDFVITGRISPAILCDTLNYLKRETSYGPWHVAEAIFTKWNKYLQFSEKLPIFKSFVLNLVEPFYKKWTFNETVGESSFDKKLRKTILNLACEFGMQKCRDESYTKFKKFINGSYISPIIRGVVISNGVRMASVEEIENLFTIYMNTLDIDLEDEIILSFRNLPMDMIFRIILNKSLTESFRSKMVMPVITSGQKGILPLIRFLSERLSQLSRLFESVPFILSKIAENIFDKDVREQVMISNT